MDCRCVNVAGSNVNIYANVAVFNGQVIQDKFYGGLASEIRSAGKDSTRNKTWRKGLLIQLGHLSNDGTKDVFINAFIGALSRTNWYIYTTAGRASDGTACTYILWLSTACNVKDAYLLGTDSMRTICDSYIDLFLIFCIPF